MTKQKPEGAAIVTVGLVVSALCSLASLALMVGNMANAWDVSWWLVLLPIFAPTLLFVFMLAAYLPFAAFRDAWVEAKKQKREQELAKAVAEADDTTKYWTLER